MSWADEATKLIEKNTKYIKPENAKQLAIYFMMAVDSGYTDYIPEFYKELERAARLPEEISKKLLEDSNGGKKGTEVLVLEKILRKSRNNAVKSIIDTALTYSMQLESEETK